ncbi:hypothetical protein LBMAG10_16640 [Actinomycetes bacterium]|nr:hypothetical protein LBMAG10_16640 [Actinomycetes bacterium]
MTEEDINEFINANSWRFAKSMPKNPHEYIVRETCTSEEKFIDFVVYIRAYGEKRRFWKQIYLYFDFDGHSYWTMGAPLTETIIINRMKI